MTNKIDTKKIECLLESKYQFYIPSYQRGYRWNKQQVVDLLEDMWEFSNNRQQNEFYCLQPIVIKLVETPSGEMKWEVIDGQQRLTTIYIILYYINNRIFQESDTMYSIEYQTRAESEIFLKDMDENRRDENIDFYHIYNAFEYIIEWFENKGNPGKIATKIYPILLEHTKVIWYEVNEEKDSIDIFTRINLGKIPLTNAELIKALFLKSDNFSDDKDLEKIKSKQLEIANEWDRIEYSLQNDKFWYFLNDGEKEYSTRIEFIFDMMSEEINESFDEKQMISKANNDYFSFLVFNKLFKEEEQSIKENNLEESIIDRLWMKIKRYYMIFEEWHSNRKLYHLVGYLVSTGVPINKIKIETDKMTKIELFEYLNIRIKQVVAANKNVIDLDFDNIRDKKYIKNILLLFNIVSLQNNKKSNIYFPFDRYKSEKWDIEHIHAVHSRMPLDKKSRTDWIESIKSEIKNEKINNMVDNFINNQNIIGSFAFEELYLEVLEEYGENEDINDISNLALLDSQTNRSYKNAIFPIKRKVILENDKKGTFIPLCTKNVFLKYYSQDIKQMNYWSSSDRKDYFGAILNTLENYLPKQKEGENIDEQ